MAPPSLLAHLDASKDSTALSLAYASIGDEGCNAVARYIRENVMLKTIDLRGNNVRADGLVVLAHALRSAPNVVSVCMKWNHVGSHERGIRALCDVLQSNHTITHLDLRNNKMGPECGGLIGNMLRHNSTITHLDLSWNDFAAEGGKALMEGLQANHSLIDCQLSGNRIEEDTLHAIAFLLRRNRQSAPLSAAGHNISAEMTHAPAPLAASGMHLSAARDLPPLGSSGHMGASRDLPPIQAGGMAPAGSSATATLPGAGPLGGSMPPPAATAPKAAIVQDEALQLKLLQKERDYTNAEDARFFGEVAEYIDLLQLDVARHKKYRMDTEERERVVTKGFMEREMRYAQEMRELENLLAKAKAEKDELLQESQHLGQEIERVKREKGQTMQDRMKIEEIARATADRLRCDIRDALAVKADLETNIYKVKRRQQEQEEENTRLRTYLEKCKDDLHRALR